MIPNIIHFIFGLSPDFGKKPFSYFHYLAVRSAYEINKPEQILFWYCYEPEGDAWEKAKHFLTLKKIVPPKDIFGKPLKCYAHQADVIRLEKLLEYGGVYLDMDVICIKPFADLYVEEKAVMGIQAGFGLCNATMMAPKQDVFISIWYNQYHLFRGEGVPGAPFWDEHSVKMPLSLSKQHPTLIRVLPADAFFHPLWHNIDKLLHQNNNLLKNSYSVHLWEGITYPKLQKITPQWIADNKSEFCNVTRSYI